VNGDGCSDIDRQEFCERQRPVPGATLIISSRQRAFQPRPKLGGTRISQLSTGGATSYHFYRRRWRSLAGDGDGGE
jgi:hypothetical protein